MTTVPPHSVPDGILDLPPGKIAAVATYLEMTRGEMARAAASSDGGPPPGFGLEPLRGQLPRYLDVYGAVGRPWLWFSRAVMRQGALAAILDDPSVSALALVRNGRDVGLLEIDGRARGICELAFLGLVPSAMGQGLGRYLVAEAIRLALARDVERLWLHTCTLDHPRALPLYVRAGFRPYRRAVEVADDPRLTGAMPRDAGNGLPIL